MRKTSTGRRLALACLAGLLLAACAGVAGSGSGSRDPLQGRLIVVAGGSGRTGAVVLRQLRAEGLAFRAMTRDVAEARWRLGTDAEGVDWVEADVRDPAQVARALAGADYVISVVGSREMSGPNSAEFVDYGGVKNLVDAAVAAKVRHVTLLSAIGASDPQSFANKLFKGALEWRFRGEQYLRASGLAYTVVRPAGLVNGPADGNGVKLWQGDDWQQHLRKTVSRDDLALVLVETLRNPGARNATFEITGEAGVPPEAWRGQLATLAPDR